MTLDQAPLGIAALVMSTTVAPGLARRLAELGLRGGQHVTPLHRTSGGGRLIAVGDTRIALSRTVLRAIEVTEA